jgi:hypothetical protein
MPGSPLDFRANLNKFLCVAALKSPEFVQFEKKYQARTLASGNACRIVLASNINIAERDRCIPLPYRA